VSTVRFPTLVSIAVLAGAALVSGSFLAGHGARSLPFLAGSGQQSVDGIHCGSQEYFVSHEHQYLALYLGGHHLDLPEHIGIFDRCLYWLHVHDASTPGGVDIIHDEQPNHRTYTLGNFLDIWAYWGRQTGGDTSYLQRLHRARSLHVFVNGRPWPHPYRRIPLRRHVVIYLEIGNPVIPPRRHDFSALKGHESPR
jgi:hypothetical protein